MNDLSTSQWNFNIETHRALGAYSDLLTCFLKGDIYKVHQMLGNHTGFFNGRFHGMPFTGSVKESDVATTHLSCEEVTPLRAIAGLLSSIDIATAFLDCSIVRQH